MTRRHQYSRFLEAATIHRRLGSEHACGLLGARIHGPRIVIATARLQVGEVKTAREIGGHMHDATSTSHGRQ